MSPTWNFVIAAVLFIMAQVFKKPAANVQDNIKMPPFTACVVILLCYFFGSLFVLLGVAAIF